MVRPRVARGFVNLADAVLHQCIRPLIGACCAPGHHGYQRAFELISGQASNGPFGSPVFACAGKTDPPCLILSQTSAGTRQLGPQGMQALPYGDAPLQQERTDLIDDSGTLTVQSIADAV